MSITVEGEKVDSMNDACRRLKIGRTTMLRLLEEGFFTEPRRVIRGVEQQTRIFDEAWYDANEPRLKERRAQAGAESGSGDNKNK